MGAAFFVWLLVQMAIVLNHTTFKCGLTPETGILGRARNISFGCKVNGGCDKHFLALDFSSHCSEALSGDQAFSCSSDATPEEGSRNKAAKKGGYSYVIDTSIPAVVADSEQPFHLHPQNGQRSSVTSTDSQLRSQLSGPSSVNNDTPSQSGRCERQRKTSVANKKAQQVKVDIVTNNKITLGRSTKNQGSYLKTHALKHDLPFKVRRSKITFR